MFFFLILPDLDTDEIYPYNLRWKQQHEFHAPSQNNKYICFKLELKNRKILQEFCVIIVTNHAIHNKINRLRRLYYLFVMKYF